MNSPLQAQTPLPAGTTECLDRDGTLALNDWFIAPTRELSVSQFNLGTASGKIDYVLIGESLRYREPLCAALAPYWQDTHVAEYVKRHAKPTAVKA
jgi:hypothetical protein